MSGFPSNELEQCKGCKQWCYLRYHECSGGMSEAELRSLVGGFDLEWREWLDTPSGRHSVKEAERKRK